MNQQKERNNGNHNAGVTSDVRGMKRKHLKRNGRKLLAFLMAVLLVLPVFAEMGVNTAHAAETMTKDASGDASSSDSTERTYESGMLRIRYMVKNQWTGHQAVEITVENTGSANVTDWSLSMENTGNITGLWNAVMDSCNEEEYIIKSKTYNNTILPGEIICFGYTLSGESLRIPETIKLYEAKKEVSEGCRVEYRKTGDWGTGFQGEITIVNESGKPVEGWSLNIRGNFTVENCWNCVMTVEEDGSYTLAHTSWNNTIEGGSSYIIGFVGTKNDEEMVISSHKLMAAADRESTETESEPETRPAETEPESKPTETESETKPTEGTTEETTETGRDEEINWEDTTDTDKDGVPDVYEIHVFHTDPENGDTDGDGLSDKEETEQYHTDPNRQDTDSDGIMDGDEIRLGLDPLNASTNGVPDSQYPVSQTVEEDSHVLKEINTSADNPYRLSLTVSAAGLAEHSIMVQGSTENMAFQNESYIGELITIDYRDTLKLDSLQLNFCMEEAVLKNELNLFGNETTELKGIRRFNVFHYIEECNMLLPIETFHDEEKNMVSAKTDEDGIYCLVDMEKWLYGLEQSIEDTTEIRASTPAVTSLSLDEEMPESMMVSLNEEENASIKSTGEEPVQNIFLGDSEFKEETLGSLMQALYPPMLLTLEEDADGEPEMIKDDRPIDIVYILQTEGNDEGFIGITWILPSIWTEYLERSYSNMRVCILELRKDGVYGNGIKNNILWHDDMGELQGYLQQIEYRYIPDVVSRGDAHAMILGETMGFREESAKFVVEIPAGVMEISPLRFERLMKYMSNCGINYSEVHDCAKAYGEATNFMEKQINLTGGKLFSIEESPSGGADDIPDHVRECMSNRAVPQKEFGAIVATGYETITLLKPLSIWGESDTDNDGLTDWEEVNTDLLLWRTDGSIQLPTLEFCIENFCEDSYVVSGLNRFKEEILTGASGVPTNTYDEFIASRLKSIRILPIHSNPVAEDSDGDLVSDFDEWSIGTKRLVEDTDCDGLSDGFELARWMDPFTADGDGDGRNDKQEYLAGTDPYCYNKEWGDHVWDFISGVVAGDFIREPESGAVLMGQIAGGFFSIADARDIVANLIYEDYVFAGLNFVGFAPILGDMGKATASLGKYILKNIDELAKVSEVFSFINRHFPDLAIAMGKSDEVIEAVKSISKTDCIKLTKEQAKVLTETIDAAGLSGYLLKSGSNLDIKYVKEFSGNVWDFPPVVRGREIDNILNQNTAEGLGKNFPVVDRLSGEMLISTKSLDLGLQSYQNPEKLRKTLEKYADKLKNFEADYFKQENSFRWGGMDLRKNQYNKKVLELVLPDVIITEEVLNVLNDFKRSVEKDGIEVWFVIGR